MKHNLGDTNSIIHILEAINNIEVFLKNVTLDSFVNNIEKRAAIERMLEIIGEAAGKLPKDFQKQFHQIEWDLIIGMRHKIIHDYFDVDMNVLRATVEEDLPILKKQILEILMELEYAKTS